jgi:thioredoxin 1
MILTITKENFNDEVLKADGAVLVDFWAEWCGPCRMMTPVLDELSKEGVKVGKVNVDKEAELAERFHIMSIPTLMVFKGGEAVHTAVGVHSKDEVLELLK